MLVAVAATALSIEQIGIQTRVVLAIFIGLVAWTALALGWTQSAERTATELARAVTYLGVFALALAAQRGRRWRPLLYGVTTGIAVVAGLAVLSRLHPQWFPPNEVGRVIVGIEIERRLAYPLNYASANGSFAMAAALARGELFGPDACRSGPGRCRLACRRAHLLPVLFRYRDPGGGRGAGRLSCSRPTGCRSW